MYQKFENGRSIFDKFYMKLHPFWKKNQFLKYDA